MKKIIVIVLMALGAISLYALSLLTNQTSSLFSGSANCQACHESDGVALDYQGVDVSPVTLWRSTMMAHSAKDPLWRAVVSEESHAHQEYSDIIESTCTRCHAPMGNRQAKEGGSDSFMLSDLYQNELALDGVSCTVCHQVQNSEFESADSYSGNYLIDNSRKIYGPYQNPLLNPMQNNVNYTPEYRAAMAHSELCATCHTLFAPYFDESGVPAGTFPEQTPYIEWKISSFPAEGQSCQECHIPKIEDGIDIATVPAWNTTLRSPFWKHDFVGGNAYMLGIIKSMETNGSSMSANSTLYDNTIQATKNNLTKAANLTLAHQGDYIQVEVTNLTGHKLPSGIPFRRMWLQLIIKDLDGIVYYESGTPTDKGRILNDPNVTFEHSDTIQTEEEIQIWEATPADVNGNPTFALLKASQFVKDNRIPPRGFDRNSPSYDTCAIYGNALSDNNFGIDGKDYIYYKLPTLPSGSYTITANLLYQTVKPGLIDYLSGISTNEITDIINLYDSHPNVPETISTKTLDISLTSIDERNEDTKKMYYSNGKLVISCSSVENSSLVIADINGKIVYENTHNLISGRNDVIIDNLKTNAVYIANLTLSDSKITYKFVK